MTDKKRQAQARHILKRLEQEAEKTIGNSPQSERSSEWTERWGRRVGLVIGYLLAALLLAHLLATYVM